MHLILFSLFQKSDLESLYLFNNISSLLFSGGGENKPLPGMKQT